MAKKLKKIIISAFITRRESGMNQTEFWSKFGVTQSGGSRYESGRHMPKPLRMLMAVTLGYAELSELADGTLAARV
jgi:transcriptional regulator with XRE-family HTH domain